MCLQILYGGGSETTAMGRYSEQLPLHLCFITDLFATMRFIIWFLYGFSKSLW